MDEKKEFSENDIQSLSREEMFRRMVFSKAEIDPLYVILGFLQEAFGGYSLDEEMVDAFFVNELKQAQIFKKLCEYYLSTLGCKNDVNFTKVESGHSHIYSKKICEKLKEEFIIREPDFINHRRYLLSEENDLYKTAEELYGNREHLYNFKRYSYLFGVIIKNKLEDQPTLNFVGAGHKTELTIQIIKEFDAFGEGSLRVDYFFNVPDVTRLTLSETNPIWQEVNKFVKKITVQ